MNTSQCSTEFCHDVHPEHQHKFHVGQLRIARKWVKAVLTCDSQSKSWLFNLRHMPKVQKYPHHWFLSCNSCNSDAACIKCYYFVDQQPVTCSPECASFFVLFLIHDTPREPSTYRGGSFVLYHHGFPIIQHLWERFIRSLTQWVSFWTHNMENGSLVHKTPRVPIDLWLPGCNVLGEVRWRLKVLLKVLLNARGKWCLWSWQVWTHFAAKFVHIIHHCLSILIHTSQTEVTCLWLWVRNLEIGKIVQ